MFRWLPPQPGRPRSWTATTSMRGIRVGDRYWPSPDSYGVLDRVWSIECALRDIKDLRFGMGMGAMHIKSPESRDRLWLINAFAVVLLTLLAAAGEALGYYMIGCSRPTPLSRRVG